MSEHVHEWTIGIMFVEGSEDQPDPTALCEICDEILNPDEIEIRVNATERLNIDTANVIAEEFLPPRGKLWHVINAYISALEGA